MAGHPYGSIYKSLEKRFWSKVVKTPGCWIWVGSTVTDGRGQLAATGVARGSGRKGGKVLATHVSWFLQYGVWPKLRMLHKCDVPSCVRPLHLYEGTDSDNRRDATERGVFRWTVTHCGRGHDQTIRPRGGKTTDKYGRRICHLCSSETRRQRKAAGKSA